MWTAEEPGRAERLPAPRSVLWDEVVEAVLPDPVTESAARDPEATGGAGDVAAALRERCADHSGLLRRALDERTHARAARLSRGSSLTR